MVRGRLQVGVTGDVGGWGVGDDSSQSDPGRYGVFGRVPHGTPVWVDGAETGVDRTETGVDGAATGVGYVSQGPWRDRGLRTTMYHQGVGPRRKRGGDS